MASKKKTIFDEGPIANLDKISAALGPASRLAYSPPHDYPMSVPKFTVSPCAERERPQCDQLRLYVHIPFCNYACSFCFFAKQVGSTHSQMKRYVHALKRELKWVEPGTPLSQLFVGGGTPTALPHDLLDEVFTEIFDRMPCDGSEVHTVETSPESISKDHIKVFHNHNIGRVSMGVQSLDEGVLDGVHRRHSLEQSLSACELLVDSGLIVNVDLMYGLPGQTYESFGRDLEILKTKNIHSVTLYNLRISERAPISRGMAGDISWSLDQLIRWRAFVKGIAEDLGFTQTRWHTFKQMDGIASRHERAAHFKSDGMGYQLGIGMSARSQLGYTVYRNTVSLNGYLERIEAGQSPVEEVLPLSLEDRKTQFVARSLGDGKPLARKDYEDAFGCTIDEDFGEAIERLTTNGLIQDKTTQLCLTETGKLVYDLGIVSFYPQDALEWLEQKNKSSQSRKELIVN